MSRSKAREIALHLIFEMQFHEFETDESVLERLESDARASVAGECGLYDGPLTKQQTAYIIKVVRGVAARQEALDAQIVRSAKGWSLRRITRISRAILRLALYEMAWVDDVPVGAAINEAVELAKTYDSEEAGRFVNGILGSAARELRAGTAVFTAAPGAANRANAEAPDSPAEPAEAPAMPSEAAEAPAAPVEVAGAPAAPSEIAEAPAAPVGAAGAPAAPSQAAEAPAAPVEAAGAPAAPSEAAEAPAAPVGTADA